MNALNSIARILPPPEKRIAMRGAIVFITLAIVTGIVLTLKFHAQSFLLTTLQKYALEQSIQLQTDSLELRLLTTSPGVRLSGFSMSSARFGSEIKADQLELSSGWWKVITGDTAPDRIALQNATLWLQPSDFDLVVPESSQAKPVANPFDAIALLTTPLPIPDTRLSLKNVQFGIAAPYPAEQIQLTLNGTIKSTKKETLANLAAQGIYHQQPVHGTVSFQSSNRTVLGSGSKLVLKADFSGSTIAAQIVTAKRKTSAPATATIVANGYNLGSLMAFLDGPDLSTGELTGNISVGKDTIKANQINVLVDRADLRADMEIKPRNNHSPKARPSLTLHVRSDYLPLDELLPLASEPQSLDSNDAEPATRVFSNTPPDLYELVQQWDANVQFNASKIHYKGYESTDLFAAALIKDWKATFLIESPEFASGTLKGKAQYDARPDTIPSGFLSIGLHNMNLGKFSTERSVNDYIADGELTTNAELWFSGLSEASLAASIDGDFYALLEDGQLDSMAVELAGADIMESLRLLWQSEIQQIAVSCGYTSMHFTSGLGELEHFIVDSEDTLFNAVGTVDLNTEKLDLTFNPIPHDSSLLTATTPITIRGMLGAPKFRPGTKLYARIATAVVLASLTGPAAALIPFIGVGDGEKSSSCIDLFKIQ